MRKRRSGRESSRQGKRKMGRQVCPDSASIYLFFLSFGERTCQVPRSKSMTDISSPFPLLWAHSSQLQFEKYRRTLIGHACLGYLCVVPTLSTQGCCSVEDRSLAFLFYRHLDTAGSLGATGHSMGGCQLETRMNDGTLLCLDLEEPDWGWLQRRRKVITHGIKEGCIHHTRRSTLMGCPKHSGIM